LEGFGSLGDEEGLAEVGKAGVVFAEGGLVVEDLDVASAVPLAEQLVELTVAGAGSGADVGEHLAF
jgi:hypothetical protein